MTGAQELRLRAEALDWRVVEGEVVALDGPSSKFLATNHSGALLWSRLHEGTTREQLVRLLAERYALSVDVAERDVDAFLGELATRDLLTGSA